MEAVCKTEFFDGAIRHRKGNTYEVKPQFAKHFYMPEPADEPKPAEHKKPGRKPAEKADEKPAEKADEKPAEKADEKPADDFLDTKLDE